MFCPCQGQHGFRPGGPPRACYMLSISHRGVRGPSGSLSSGKCIKGSLAGTTAAGVPTEAPGAGFHAWMVFATRPRCYPAAAEPS